MQAIKKPGMKKPEDEKPLPPAPVAQVVTGIRNQEVKNVSGTCLIRVLPPLPHVPHAVRS